MLTWLSKRSKASSKRNNILWLTIGVAIAIPLTIHGWDRYKDRQIKVAVTEPTPIYATETDAAYGSLAPIKTIPPGEHLKVKRTTYGKDYWALEIRTSDGTVGWVVSGQKGIAIRK